MVTDKMYLAFRDVICDVNAHSETQMDLYKNAIEAALEAREDKRVTLTDLKARRKSIKRTLSDVNEITGLAKGYLCDIEHDRYMNPSLSTCMLLAKGYDVHITSILEYYGVDLS